MRKQKLVYIWSLRNAAADKAGQSIPYKGGERYMKSPLEYLAEVLDTTALGDAYSLEAVINDDDDTSPRDREQLRDYGEGRHWYFPRHLTVQGKRMTSLLRTIASTYRQLPLASEARPAGKRAFEAKLQHALQDLEADVVVLDGLLVILDELVRPGARFERKIVNIHPGITRAESPYQRRGAYATLDALHAARGEQVDWQTRKITKIPPLYLTGASFHYVDNGVDSGEVIHELLATRIEPDDTIFELRWNNFHNSLFPALHQGLMMLPDQGLQRLGGLLTLNQ
jgi:folate-dependent phosphoribosylglycinamide formyltransferase PurN